MPEELDYMRVRRALAARMRELRRVGTDAELPQREAARRAGIDQSYWTRLEGARCDPSLSSMLKIQRAFDLDSIEALLGPTPSQLLTSTKQ